jgi:alpha-2-macroglobulin
MKPLPILLFAALAFHASALEVPRKKAGGVPAQPRPAMVLPDDPRPFTNDPSAGGITIDSIENPLAVHTFLNVTFPRPMVADALIDVPGGQSPLVFWPDLDAAFTWRTPSSGELMVKGPVMPGQTYRIRLAEGLGDALGDPLPVDAWGVEMHSPPLRVVWGDYGEREALGSRPQVVLEFNYPVDLASVPGGAWFQDRETRRRYPAEVFLNTPSVKPVAPRVVDVRADLPQNVFHARFRPVDPLPVGRTFDFVADGIRDAFAGRSLPYPFVTPLGTTRPPEVDFVAATNSPLEKPAIIVKFDSSLDAGMPVPADALEISPSVPNLRTRIEGPSLIAEGDFTIPGKYRVVVADAVKAATGYGLAKSEVWGATFRERRGNVIFPDRVIRQRSAAGMRFAFHQVNTGPLTWRLASVPADKLAAVRARLDEFREFREDADGNPLRAGDGYFSQVPTGPLIGALGLPVIAQGGFEASGGDAIVLREIAWKPADGDLGDGPALLEVTGRDGMDRLVGNRALILFSELALTRKVEERGTVVRVARMDDGLPVPGAKVVLLDSDVRVLAAGETDGEGVVAFSAEEAAGADSVAAESKEGPSIQPFDLSARFPGGYGGWRDPSPFRTFTFTDRPLYRPGQTVHFKGMVREMREGTLEIPARQDIVWEVRAPYSGEVVADGSTPLDAGGGWHGQWTPPEGAATGGYSLTASAGGARLGDAVFFRIEEFRNPPFSVVCSEVAPARPGESTIRVASAYFHGAPNAGARLAWQATWYGDSDDGFQTEFDPDGMNRVDLHSKDAPRPAFFAEAAGEVSLDANGTATITCVAPFPDPANRAVSTAFWRVDVTGPEGQTITGGSSQRVAMVPTQLGVRTVGPRDDNSLVFAWNALEPFEKLESPPTATLYHVEASSVRERLAPGVYRFRNADTFTKVSGARLEAPGEFGFPVTRPGRYVVVVSPASGSGAIAVSAEAAMPGPGEAAWPVDSETSVKILPIGGDRDSDGDAVPWQVGETASFTVVAPSAGVAWVSIEAGNVLDSFTVPLEGNTARIDVPVRESYEPNAFLSACLLRPGGPDAPAGEMFGSTGFKAVSPDRRLDLLVETDRPAVEPRETISGRVRATAGGKPVAGADLAIYAVDDSILTLGGWGLPKDITRRFFPERAHRVATYSALEGFVDGISPSWLTAKGFVVGGGGEDEFGNVTFVRKDFQPLILWIPSVKTDAAGLAAFSAPAPDNTGRFRFVAIGQTTANQFGAGDTTVEVSKSLMVEPALPRFLREGDEVELRALVRQTAASSGAVAIRCEIAGDGALEGEATQEISVAGDAPSVVTFRARAERVGEIQVKFLARMGGMADAIEVGIPVLEPVVLVREAVAGAAAGPSLRVADLAPEAWSAAAGGNVSLAVSTSPWLPKLSGIPFLLEYPHGCFEQISSRLLVYTHLARLLEFVPAASGRTDPGVVSDALRLFEAGLLPDGMLPYWPGGTVPDVFVTAQVAWCTLAAMQAGIEVPGRLASAMPRAMRVILDGSARDGTPTLRAFALFMLASTGGQPEDDLAGQAAALLADRDRLTAEGRALLALALDRMDTMPDAAMELVRSLPDDFGDTSFNPFTFASPARTEAICTWARLAIDPKAGRAPLIARLEALMESSQSLSTQENLWLLLAFNALLEVEPKTSLRPSRLKPPASEVSGNETAAAWTGLDIHRLGDFKVSGLPRFRGGSFVLSASYRTARKETPAVSRGMRIERVLKNLTDPARTGSPGTPLQLGDEILVSYRFASDKAQSYVALEDMLPAGLEVVNPDLAQFARILAEPPDPGLRTAPLSHAALRDAVVNLYFDSFPEGTSTWSVLARATAAGSFVWPSTQLYPMYDARFSGRSPSGRCVIGAPR